MSRLGVTARELARRDPPPSEEQQGLERELEAAWSVETNNGVMDHWGVE
ncbi:hypothetical protein H310_14765 [Aphanomyces invadans]|uniref:Uncharacterized protein n=1 Tax=Aphanomyces invadans TaxID=157072 RepID=A0A024TA16_9STRA|nr:hypothetical protein H310_14765 [Aphanomyces invadans]ETV90441.1 hypothetical protein H310_14765 [Aphanomyces invadans]|eukprot:XP_008880915.1 hypothetical protein H310_14765 [Aphanomyces invadans]